MISFDIYAKLKHEKTTKYPKDRFYSIHKNTQHNTRKQNYNVHIVYVEWMDGWMDGWIDGWMDDECPIPEI